MGRETKILLGLLGLLSGAFMGVLSMKLLVPRPPAGAGPDVNTELASAEPHDLVEPPSLTMPASAFAAAPPLVATPAGEPAVPPPASDRYAGIDVGNATEPPREPATTVRRDPFVAAAAFEQPDDPSADPAIVEEPGLPPTAAERPAPREEPPVAAAAFDPGLQSPSPAGGYVVREGDSWWSLAERAYGDGRLYRALFAWNRAMNPRVSLAPGTPLQVPPLADLTAAWPQLLPR